MSEMGFNELVRTQMKLLADEIHLLQLRVKELNEENQELKTKLYKWTDR